MNIIRIIFVERLLFDSEVKESLNKYFKNSGIKVSYYDGYIVTFEKSNVYSITPHRIVFSKNEYNLLVLHYDEYHENNNLYLIPNEKEPFTIGSMKKYVRQYFGMIYKMNCKRNDN